MIVYASHRRLPYFPFVAVSVLAALLAACLGNDFRDSPLGVDKWDHGWLIAIEPEEELWVDLLGNAAFPDAKWQVVEADSAVLKLESEEHEEPRQASGDPDATEAGEYDPGSLVSRSGFGFVGVALGETPLRFELAVDGEPVDIAEFTVAVVPDSCEAATAAVANRCGGDGFTYHSQVLHEQNFGEEIALTPGEVTRLVLTANALHQEQAWQVVDYDASVISVEAPGAVEPPRRVGDFSEVSADSPHSFLPAWEFAIRGLRVGETALVLEIDVEGERIDLFRLDVIVE